MSAATSPASLLRSSRLSAGACAQAYPAPRPDVLTDENESVATKKVSSRQARAQAPTDRGEERRARPLA